MRTTDDGYEVRDAILDPLFAQYPLVTGEPHIRFYAGAPLLLPEGQPLGTLCAIDTVLRPLSNDQRLARRILTWQAMGCLKLRRTNLQLEDERQKLEGVLRIANSFNTALYSGSRNEIFVKRDQRFVRVTATDLQYVEALGDCVNMHATRERLTMYGTMKDFETKLPGRDFARVHHKYIVRLDRGATIEAMWPCWMGYATRARTPVRVPIGNSCKATLLRRLNLV